MENTTGNLVLVDVNTVTPKVYWKGQQVLNIIKIVVRNDEDDADVKIVASQTNAELQDMIASGINIKIRGVI